MRHSQNKLISLAFIFICMKVTNLVAQDAPKPPLPEEKQVAPTSPDGSLNLDMNLDQLSKQNVVVPGLSTEVSTVERHTSTIGRSPNAVFVITNEMIKRSGARNIPDALRMAPGLQIARINAHTYAITARGFNDKVANFLLVQIDGRVVYQGTFGGVYWNQQDVVLADVERIEVIRGPGTTMWGSNAVNGVINIITKNTRDTQGALAQGGGGVGQERGFVTGRYGGTLNSTTTYRVYAQQFDNSPAFSETDVPDAQHAKHGGFRIDSTPNKQDTFTFQGSLYEGKLGQQFHDLPFQTPPYSRTVDDTTNLPASNLLMRYSRKLDEDTSWQLQGYFDHYEQNTSYIQERRNTYDIDFQYQCSPITDHHFISGVNYRNSQDHIGNSFQFAFYPDQFITEWVSVYSQDTITLEEDRWYFTLGCRLEEHTLGGFQAEPTARLLFLPTERQSMWAAVSRAARNPTRLDQHFNGRVGLDPTSPLYLDLLGSPTTKPENVVSYELGYRAAPTDIFTWDIAGYVNEYNDLFSVTYGDPVVTPDGAFVPAVFGNNNRAISYGFETTATRQMHEDWKLFLSYSVFEVATSTVPDNYIRSAPHNQIYLQSSWDYDGNKQFDLIGRYTDSLAIGVPKYFEMDARWGWQMTDTLELSFFGRNLLDSHHLEFTGDPYVTPTEVRRSWYAMLTWVY